MNCEYCGIEFQGRKKKYCSQKCCRAADRDNKRIVYKGQRLENCIICGKALPKYKTRYCSEKCLRKQKTVIEKECPICGKEFQTYKDRKITCSERCSKEYSKEHSKDRKKIKYKSEHPGAVTREKWLENIKKKKEENLKLKKEQADERKYLRDLKLQKVREKRLKKKKENIDFWQNYCKLHECENCKEMFIAYYPLTKYCNKCVKTVHKQKRRYKGITLDSGITLKKLAYRDENKCKLCGKVVNWSDYEIKAGTVICGDNYPSIDHIKPISRGGLHSWENIQLAHRRCNYIKKDNI